MQPRNLPADAPAAELDFAELDEPDEGALDVLLPHAASSTLAVAATAAVISAVCFTIPPLDLVPAPGHGEVAPGPDLPAG
jgi:hypothetical protein